MDAIGRFGIIMPEINSPLDHEFIEGAYAQAQILGYDIVIYTGVFNSIRELRYDSYVSGLENIYTLIDTQRLDGIIFAAERFHNQDVIKKIKGYIAQTDTPCLVLGGECAKAVSMEADEYSSMYRITRHMTDEHSCKKLYCLAGIPGHRSSEERLRGFKDACKDSGISISENDIVYGLFWKGIPEQLGRDIANGSVERPDAVVCCSDVMAVELIAALSENGIRVPEDVKVTGFDGGWDSLMCQTPITTVTGRDKQFGADAVCRLYEMTKGTMPKQELFSQTIRYGRSCGCCKDMPMEPHLIDMILRHREKRTFIATDFIHRMSEASTITELSERIDEVGHIFGGIEWLDICLCDDWKGDSNNPDVFRQYGYPDEMYLLLSKRIGDNNKAHCKFRTADILPALSIPHEPHLIIMISLHCSGQIYGYTAAGYTDSRRVSVDEYLVSWCDSISNGVRSLQKKLYLQHFTSQLEKLSESDPVTGMLNRRGFMVNAPEILNGYRNDNRKSWLLMMTYYPDKIGSVSPDSMIGNIIMEICSHRLCAKISESVYSIILPGVDEQAIMNTSENLVAAIESGLRERLGDLRLPEFLTAVSALDSVDIADIEKNISDMIQQVTDKKEAVKNNYTDYKEQIYRLRRNIISEPQKEWDVDEIAHSIGISRSHLQRLYKQLFSFSVKDDVINARIRRAMQLLTHTSMRIQEISEMCGYNNHNHFMRQFKEKTGITAAQYRKENTQRQA